VLPVFRFKYVNRRRGARHRGGRGLA
jgi:hypothetical protein